MIGLLDILVEKNMGKEKTKANMKRDRERKSKEFQKENDCDRMKEIYQ
jgi:hypothetical protein